MLRHNTNPISFTTYSISHNWPLLRILKLIFQLFYSLLYVTHSPHTNEKKLFTYNSSTRNRKTIILVMFIEEGKANFGSNLKLSKTEGVVWFTKVVLLNQLYSLKFYGRCSSIFSHSVSVVKELLKSEHYNNYEFFFI